MGLGLLIRVVGGFPFSLSEDLTVLGLAVVCGSLFLLLLVLLEEVELGFLCIWEGVGLLPTNLVVEGYALIQKLFMGGAHPAKPALGWHGRVMYDNTNKFCVCEWRDSAYRKWQAVHV